MQACTSLGQPQFCDHWNWSKALMSERRFETLDISFFLFFWLFSHKAGSSVWTVKHQAIMTVCLGFSMVGCFPTTNHFQSAFTKCEGALVLFCTQREIIG